MNGKHRGRLFGLALLACVLLLMAAAPSALAATVTWDWETGSDSQEVEAGADIPSHGDPSREGYDFAGWKNLPENKMGDEDITIYAIWEHNTHVYEAVETHDPTCTEQGYTVYQCKYCSDSYQGDVVDPLDHSFTNYTYNNDATCTTAGTKTAKCDRCDVTDTVEDSEHPALGHSFTKYVSNNDATCTTDGTKTAKCDRCDATETVADTGSAKGHNWGTQITYTLSEDKKTVTGTRVCQNDSAHTDSATADVTATVTKAATTAEAGVMTYSATFENSAFGTWSTTEEIPKLTVPTISSIDKLNKIKITYKPAIKDALKMLPTSVNVTLSDKSTTTATLTWTEDSCKDYADKDDDGDYTFTAATIKTKDGNALGEGVGMPTVTMTVGTETYGPYTYRLNAAGELTIVSCAVETTAIDVPESIEGHPVTYIGSRAFRNATKLVTLKLPKGIKTIGNSAFAGCTALESLTLPDSLEESPAANIVKDDALLDEVILRTDLDTTLSANNTFSREVTVNKKTTVLTITLPVAITDIYVNSGTLTLDFDYLVASGYTATVNTDATLHVAADRTLTNLGTVYNYGTVTYNGKIVTCGGSWPNNAPTKKKGGSYVTEHVYKDGYCTGCGIKEEVTVTDLTIRYTGSSLTKVYDKTRNVTLKGSDFTISGTQSGHTAVRISAIRAAYDSANVGSRTVSVSFTLGGDDAARYKASDITIPATITAKALVITPTEDQKKSFGAADPTYFTGKVKGLLSGDTISGRLARQSGENVGKYKIIQGTISAGDNYAVEVSEAYFTIEAKSINSSDVGLVTIGNQRYTGKAITPAISLRFGTNTLKQDTDFKAVFSDNIQPGTAKVKLTGIGNYTGERDTTFRILNVSEGGGSSGGSGSSGGGYSYDYDDDDDDEDDEDEDDDEEEDEDEKEDIGNLVLDDTDYGTVLFGAAGAPEPFVLFEDETLPGQRVLTIIPDPMVDEESGDEIYLGNSVRERYDELHLRIGAPLVQTLMEKGYTEIVYEVEQADLRVPLSALVSEIPLEEPEPIVPEEGGEAAATTTATEDDEELDIAPTVLQVASYDICLEQVDAVIEANTPEDSGETLDEDAFDGMSQGQFSSASQFGGVMHIGADGKPTTDEAPTAEPTQAAEGDDETMAAAEPIDPAVLAAQQEAERLAKVLDEHELLMPAYRVRIRVITEEQEVDATQATEATQPAEANQAAQPAQDGLESDQEPEDPNQPKRLPEGYYPRGITLRLLPTDDVTEASEGIQQLFISDIEDPEQDADLTELTPAQFVELEGTLYAQIIPTADGTYTVVAPVEEMSEDEMSEVDMDEDEGEYEAFEASDDDSTI